MGAEPNEVVSRRRASERGALVSAAGALGVAAAAGAWRPDLLARLVGAEPAPQLLALFSLAAALPAGAAVGRRAIRLRADPERRRRLVMLWTFLAYLGPVGFAATAVRIGVAGPAVLAEPLLLATQALLVAALLLPWGALPVALTAMALERWTRPRERRRPPPGGGPGPGPGERAPVAGVVALADARRREEPAPVRRAA